MRKSVIIGEKGNNMAWDDFFEDEIKCSECGTSDMVESYGSGDTFALFILDYPEKDEIRSGKAIAGSVEGILKSEISKLRGSIRDYSFTTIWKHIPNGNEKCRDIGFAKTIEEANKFPIIILMGKLATELFINQKYKEFSGLQVTSLYLPDTKIFVCPHPKTLFGGGVGEFRLALGKIMNEVKECF